VRSRRLQRETILRTVKAITHHCRACEDQHNWTPRLYEYINCNIADNDLTFPMNDCPPALPSSHDPAAPEHRLRVPPFVVQPDDEQRVTPQHRIQGLHLVVHLRHGLPRPARVALPLTLEPPLAVGELGPARAAQAFAGRRQLRELAVVQVPENKREDVRGEVQQRERARCVAAVQGVRRRAEEAEGETVAVLGPPRSGAAGTSGAVGRGDGGGGAVLGGVRRGVFGCAGGAGLGRRGGRLGLLIVVRWH
ncbi:hypothetical protein DFJ74DRAFT_730878, partial [Hyaloraphidium curvatum]